MTFGLVVLKSFQKWVIKHSLRELRSYFEDYKMLENKSVLVEDFQEKDIAQDVVRQAIADYEELINEMPKTVV